MPILLLRFKSPLADQICRLALQEIVILAGLHLQPWEIKHKGLNNSYRLLIQKLWLANWGAIVNFLCHYLPISSMLVRIGDTLGVRLLRGYHEKFQEVFYILCRVIGAMHL